MKHSQDDPRRSLRPPDGGRDDPFGEVMRMFRLLSAQAKNKADLSRFAGSDRFLCPNGISRYTKDASLIFLHTSVFIPTQRVRFQLRSPSVRVHSPYPWSAIRPVRRRRAIGKGPLGSFAQRAPVGYPVVVWTACGCLSAFDTHSDRLRIPGGHSHLGLFDRLVHRAFHLLSRSK